MGQTIGQLLPYALGVALSPVPIIAVVVMLGTPRARANGSAFALGWVAGLSLVSVVVFVLARGADQAGGTEADSVNWVKIALGVLLLVLAVRRWRGRPAPGEEAPLPDWMSSVDHFNAGRSLLLGLALSAVNPKNLVLTAGAAAVVAQSGLSAAESFGAEVVFVVLASVTVVGLVLAYLVAGDRAKAPLESVKAFMGAHNDVIMMVILLLLGAKLIGDGLA
jgi:threonine/homoserine/homoserine lactone efflux protein